MAKKPTLEQAKKLTFRLGDEHGERILEYATKFGISPNQVGKIYTIIMLENRFHQLPEKVGRVEDTMIRLLQNVSELVHREGE